LEFVRSSVPNLKAIGIVYNPGESNSASQIKEMQELVSSLDVTLVLAMATKTAEVAGATQSLIGRVDAILIPNDNTAVAAIESAVLVAKKHNCPIFAADFGSFDRGVDAAIGYSRSTLGEEAGFIACDILNGKPPSQISIKHSHSIQIKRKAP
jgi:putative ABC transport system substrate-binding protein